MPLCDKCADKEAECGHKCWLVEQKLGSALMKHLEDAPVAPLEASRAEAEEEDLGVAGDHCGPGNECGRLGCPGCQQ